MHYNIYLPIYYLFRFNKLNSSRAHSAAAFIEPNIGRPNLHVLVNSHVTRVLFNNQGGRPIATGVEFVRNNRTYTVSASREVILSAGSINSPQKLMLSGVGPRDHLSQLGIPLLADLPVGNNSIGYYLVRSNRLKCTTFV